LDRRDSPRLGDRSEALARRPRHRSPAGSPEPERSTAVSAPKGRRRRGRTRLLVRGAEAGLLPHPGRGVGTPAAFAAGAVRALVREVHEQAPSPPAGGILRQLPPDPADPDVPQSIGETRDQPGVKQSTCAEAAVYVVT